VGKVENGIISGLDWFPTFVAAAGYHGDIAADLRQGKNFGGHTCKVHLDGYNQIDMLIGKGPSKRHEISTSPKPRSRQYGSMTTNSVLPTSLTVGLAPRKKVDWPILTNLRFDPFERTGMYNGKDNGSIAYYNCFVDRFWRFIFVQQEVARYGQTYIAFPPMQKGTSFNISQVKEQIQKALVAYTDE
jgi:hypothetical protein